MASHALRCVLCGSRRFLERVSPPQIELEEDLRARFIRARLDYHPDAAGLKDLTDFMHGGPGRLLECTSCRALLRDEREPEGYAGDLYDSALVKHLYPRYLSAFREKEDHYRHLLPPGAGVLEIGCHYGAFLQTAEEWGWKPTGLDIGRSTTSFVKAAGLRVFRRHLGDHSSRSLNEAVFIWNCFEQLDEPGETLLEARRHLKQHGLLVLRVPNSAYYRRWSARLRRGASRGASRGALLRLGYNNLLAFPHLHGYCVENLSRMLTASGFRPLQLHASHLLTLPLASLPAAIETEASAVWSEQAGCTPRQNQPRPGPWIEVIARMCSS